MLQSMGSQRVRLNLKTELKHHTTAYSKVCFLAQVKNKIMDVFRFVK